MKKVLLASLFILCVGYAHAQDNPYAIFGYKVKTILKDNPEELLNVQNTDKSSKIKSFTFDPIKKCVWLKDENGKIVGSVPVKPTDIKRFLSIDRFSEKYYQMNPYHYALNNPIKNIDINGDSVVVMSAPEGAGGFGHAAVLIGNEKTGWRLFSKNGTGQSSGFKGANDVGDNRGTYFKNLSAFANDKNSPQNTVETESGKPEYQAGYMIISNSDTDKKMEKGAFSVLKYPFINSLCYFL
jgi:hypothetical protein